VPLGLAGLVFADMVTGVLRSPAVIAATTAGFGVLLWLADHFQRGERSERNLSIAQAVMIGLAQVLALVPGTSRSGITMTAGLALGLSRAAAARFSFLLSIPAIGMAASWEAYQLSVSAEPVLWGALTLAAALSAATAFAAIAAFLRLVERIGLWAFAVYRLLLAGLILIVLY
jgi:undecaprenyl-diphosphatase